MKAPRQSVRLRRLPIAPRIGALWYLLLLLACTIFTQALRSPLSAVVLNFVLLLPIADLICLAISWFFVSVTIEGSDRIIERGEPLAVPMSITNRGILPLSCVEVMFSIPLPYALHSQAVAKRVAIPPVSAVTTKVALDFTCRGFFDMGVEELFLFDFLRLVRIRKKIHRYVQIQVLPKPLTETDALPPFSDNGSFRHDPLESNSLSEYDDVRAYRPGDSMKSIHWKLSTKWEEWQIRKHVAEGNKELQIFADFETESTYFSMSEYHAAILGNRIAEESLTVAIEAAKQGAEGQLLWFQPDGTPVIHSFQDQQSAKNLAFPLSEAEGGSEHLPQDSLIHRDASALCVLAFLSPTQEDKLRRLAATCAGAPFVILLLSAQDLVAKEQQKTYDEELAALGRRLTDSGIPVTISCRREASS